jgi:hypothetical protein
MSARSLNGLSGSIYINTITGGSAIDITGSTTASTCNVDISKQSAKTTIADTDLYLLEETDGTIKKITGANLKSGMPLTSNWILNTNLYPLATGTDVVIGSTTNTNSRKLLVTGTFEVTGNSYLNTISTGVWNGTRLGKDYVPSDTVFDADLLTAVAFSTSQASAFNIGRGGSSYAYSNVVKGWNITLGETPAADGSDAGSVGTSVINLLSKTGYSSNEINLECVPVYNQGINSTINLTATSRSGGTAQGASNINITANDTSASDSNGSTITLSAETEVIINSGFKIGSTGTVTSGVWSGTAVAVNKGGTGQTTYTNGQLLIGNTTGNTLTKATITGGTNVTVTNGTGTISIAATDTNTTYTGGTNITLSGTTFNLDAGLSGLTTINMSGKLTGTGTSTANGFSLLNGNFYSAVNELVVFKTADDKKGYSHENTGGSSNASVVSYVNNAVGAIGNEFANAWFGLFNEFLYTLLVDGTNRWTKIGNSLTTVDNPASNLEVINTNASDARDCQIQMTQTHASAGAGLVFKTASYTNYISCSGSNGQLLYGNNSSSTTNLFYGRVKTANASFYAGTDNSTIHLEMAVNHATGSSSGSSFVTCYYNEVQIGDIGQSGTTNVVFNTSSDYRLKTDVTDFNESLDLINKLKVKKYKFINDKNENINQEYIGFIAHEAQAVCPELFNSFVSGSKNDKQMYCKKCNKFYCSCGDDCGDMEIRDKYQKIDYSKLTPYLVGCIQEQQKQIDDLKVIINNLITSKTFKEFKSK